MGVALLLSGSPIAFHKAALLAASLVFVGLISQTWLGPVLVLSLLTVNFFTLAGQFRIGHGSNILLWANWTVLPVSFFLLQLSGDIGVLTNRPAIASGNTVLLGLPFYTLSILSINHEIQTGRIKRPSWIDYVLFGLYFPKFLSGPVEQPTLLPKLANFRFRYEAQRFNAGCDWLILGLFCKFIVAYYLSRNVRGLELLDVPTILLSVCAFELQVYFDLGGYSFMAYGVSLMLGLQLTLNFNHPFFAGNIQSFWQRWHISLGRWFHGYVYTPLRGMDPKSPTLKLVLPVLVFLLSAMWHGQTLNFLMWGLWHALAYIAYVRLLSQRSWPKLAGILAMAFVLLVGRLLFMESNWHALLLKIERLLSWDAWVLGLKVLVASDLDPRITGNFDLLVAFTLCAAFLFAEFHNQRRGLPAYAIFRSPTAQWILIGAGLLLVEGGVQGFIYARQ